MSARRAARTVIDLEAFRGEGTAAGRQPSVAVLDTSELRWFADGLPPGAVVDWFTCGGKVGTLEERCDTYQLHRLLDIGVKRRSRITLEVKVRREIGDTVTLAPGLAAAFEEWRKWSPTVGDPMSPSADTPWIDVEKAVLTRTFMLADHEVVGPAPHVDDSLSGADVEIAAVTVAGVDAWSLAFETFGPKVHRSRVVRTAWAMLIDSSGVPEQLGSYFAFAGGYPEWLARIAADLDGRSAGWMTHRTG
jgi:hypothetical protein